MTLRPWDIEPADIEVLHDHGLPDEAIAEAMYVCTTFNVIDRLADAFDFKMSDTWRLAVTQRLLGRIGYDIASLPG